MTYEQAQQYLLAGYNPKTKKGLENIGLALEKLGNPHDKLKIIHVAGTNGKGSACAMLAAVLQTTGYRVGVFTSPHLVHVNERFSINNQIISDEDFARHLGRVANISREMFGSDPFSFFEALTLMAFDYFCAQNVDIVLLEVGIGGRLDATNAVKQPLLSVIMSIGFDHMEILGDTLEKIAQEKGGIIKENCPVVLYSNPQMVYNVFTAIAATKNSKIYHAGDVAIDALEETVYGTNFIAKHEYYGEMCIKLSLIGRYQLQNAACVIAACAALCDAGHAVDADDIIRGLAAASFGGRMEVVSQNPLIVLEGAHNLQGAEAAAQNMQNLFRGKEITLLAAVLADKQYAEILQTLAKHAARAVLTKPSYDAKAVPPLVLAKTINGIETYVEENPINALQKAIAITPKDGVIFCSGSLYLIGDMRHAIIKKGG